MMKTVITNKVYLFLPNGLYIIIHSIELHISSFAIVIFITYKIIRFLKFLDWLV